MTSARILNPRVCCAILILLTACATFVRTPLHVAVSNPAVLPSEIRALIDAGVDVNAFDPQGYNALMYAARYASDPAVVRLLVASGANVDLMSRLTDVNLNSGSTALHLAAQFNRNPAVVRALIDAGARVNEPDFHRDRPLHVAARSNDPSVIAALIAGGANRTTKDRNGMTAYDLAIAAQRIDAIERAGVDLQPPVVVAQGSAGDNSGKWIAGALMAGLLASQAENIPAEKLVEIAGAAAADLMNETGGENLRRIAEGAPEAAAGAALPADTTPDGPLAPQDINGIIRQMEGQCVGATYRGSRNPDDHTTTFQCAAAFNLECNLRRARSGGRSAEWIAAAERYLRTQCQRIAELQEMGLMGACPHCSSALDVGCGGS